jgi:hypothetical protein
LARWGQYDIAVENRDSMFISCLYHVCCLIIDIIVWRDQTEYWQLSKNLDNEPALVYDIWQGKVLLTIKADYDWWNIIFDTFLTVYMKNDTFYIKDIINYISSKRKDIIHMTWGCITTLLD